MVLKYVDKAEFDFINLRNKVRAVFANELTGKQIRHVANMIFNEFKKDKVFGMNISLFNIASAPFTYRSWPNGQMLYNYQLDGGRTIYFGVCFE